jgi:hypothetical protein
MLNLEKCYLISRIQNPEKKNYPDEILLLYNLKKKKIDY